MKKIDESLNMRPLKDIKDETKKELAEYDPNQSTKDDIDYVMSNIHRIIEKGNEGVEEMFELARQSESPRAFEVMSGLIKTLLDANKDYMAASLKRSEFEKQDNKDDDDEGNGTRNTINFIGSTEDIMKLINREMNEKTIEHKDDEG